MEGGSKRPVSTNFRRYAFPRHTTCSLSSGLIFGDYIVPFLSQLQMLVVSSVKEYETNSPFVIKILQLILQVLIYCAAFTIPFFYPNHRILFDPSGQRAVGVEYEQGGETKVAHADKVILSGGAINSPQLLMLSGVGPAQHLREVGVEVVVLSQLLHIKVRRKVINCFSS